MINGYAAKNITEIANLIGLFNSIVKGKMLIILNQQKNCCDNRLANKIALMNISTDD